MLKKEKVLMAPVYMFGQTKELPEAMKIKKQNGKKPAKHGDKGGCANVHPKGCSLQAISMQISYN